jgi:hypothetical protein
LIIEKNINEVINSHNDQLASQIQYQLKLIKELTNVRLSIHWAKKEIINPLIFSKAETIEIEKIVKKTTFHTTLLKKHLILQR